jgi:hypothetical protein
MGTPVAVCYANMVLSYLEQDLLDRLKPILYMRYIDDLFVICTSHDIADRIVINFNSKCPCIQLDEITVGKSGIFLDLMLTISSDNKIISSIYQKSMNKYLYIPPTSNHNNKIISNMIIQEIKRYRFHCSLDIDYYTVRDLFRKRLIDRGYTNKYLDPLFNRTYDRAIILEATYIKKVPSPSSNKPIIPVLLPEIRKPINLSKLFSLPDEIINSDDYNKVYNKNNIMIGRCSFPSIGRTLVYRPINKPQMNITENSNNINNNTRKRRLEMVVDVQIVHNEPPLQAPRLAISDSSRRSQLSAEEEFSQWIHEFI